MCGIFGFLSIGEIRSDIENRKQILKRMCDTLKHRGPDEEGFYADEAISFGHTRLSIIDLDTGKQPIHNETQTIWIVFNGEIYNFLELRKHLINRGHRFYTKSDTEVILHLYEEEGEDCVNKINGMFAFAVWDKTKRKLFLARDPVGKKPLHWIADGKEFIFASEIKALLAYPGINKNIDANSLSKYFLFGFVPAPKTIFAGINKLLPAHCLTVSAEGIVREKKYWEIDYSQKLNNYDKQAIKKEAVDYLKAAVKERLVSDVPLGVFLSGGVDSSLVTAMMAKLISPSQIHAFSIGFNEKGFDESIYSEMVAKYLKINHHLKIFSPREVLNLIPKIACFLDEPMSDPSILPTYLLSSFTRESVKVALSGDGGDESFAGYPKYLAQLFLKMSRLEKLPLYLARSFFAGKINTFLRYSSYPLHLRNQLWISHIPLQDTRRLLKEKADYFEDIEGYHQIFNGTDPVDEALFIDQKMTLPDLYLVKTDRASMAASLEVRSPFLDKKVVEFSAKIPLKLKMEGFKTKALLKEIAAEFLPRKAIYRPKMGFGIPLLRWLKDELRPLVCEVTSLEKIRKEGILNPQAVERIVKSNNPNQVWSLLVFELWYQKWMRN